jgi:hypothetical protein
MSGCAQPDPPSRRRRFGEASPELAQGFQRAKADA